MSTIFIAPWTIMVSLRIDKKAMRVTVKKELEKKAKLESKIKNIKIEEQENINLLKEKIKSSK